MTESHGESLPRADNPAVGHETRDINVRLILWTAAILVASAIVIHLAVWAVFVRLKEGAAKPGPNPLAVEEGQRSIEERIKELRDERHQPPLEGLQHYQSPDEFAMPGKAGGGPRQASKGQRPGGLRASVQPDLHGYGPPEPAEPGFARIPIERAIDMALRKNKELLPARPGARPAPPRTGLDTPTTSNSGHGPGSPPP